MRAKRGLRSWGRSPLVVHYGAARIVAPRRVATSLKAAKIREFLDAIAVKV